MMLKFAVSRIAAIVPVLLIVSFVVFGLIHLSPGDPALAIAGERATLERVEEIRESLGYNDPLLQQYGDWAVGALQGDLGTSLFSTLPVVTAITARLSVTLSLTAAAIVMALVIGVPLGLFAGLRQNSLVDRVLTAGATVGIAVPHFWLGTMLILIFALRWDMLPATGYVALTEDPVEWLRHMLMPAAALGAATVAEISRQMRSATITQRDQDYMRTAQAKGLSSLAVNGKHLMKNAAVPVVTVVGLQVARLLGGAIIVEQVFAMPGLGQLAIQAVLRRDMPMIQGIVIFTTLVVVAMNLIVDISYSYFNPRVREASA